MKPTACPKCGHTRAPGADAPAWQCPACGVAYTKYAGYLKRMELSAAITPRPRDANPLDWAGDRSLWTLIAANLLSLGLAVIESWTLAELMMLYWAQSVTIGAANVVRILSLSAFSTTGFKINDVEPPQTRATKVKTATFFAIHYGIFHLVYLMFLVDKGNGALDLDVFVIAGIVAFALNHLYSVRYNIEMDARGEPNIGTLMMTPYLRIIPMHVMIVGGSLLDAAGLGVMIFIALKTAADAVMHLIEHAVLAKARDGERS